MKLFIILCLNFIFVYATQVPLNFDLVINNLGASHGGDFDGLGNRFVCDELASSEYRIGSLFFKTTRKQFDNAMCRGQVLTLPNQSLGGMYMLGSVNHGPVTTKMVVAYKDGTQTTTTLNIPDWQVRHTEQIERLDLAPCRLNTGAEGQLFLIPLLVDPTKNVSHLTFPYTDTLGWFRPALHVFGITALPANDGVTVVAAKGTRRTYISRSGREYQIVMVRVHNTSPAWIDEGYVSIMGTLLKTHKRGRVKKLAPGHIVSVEVTIRTLRTTMEKTSILVDVTDNDGHPIALSTVLDDVELGIEDYKGTEESLRSHIVPDWYKSSKFGIFIHWGVYSVPSWAPVGKNYAEWYWWNYNQRNSETYRYHRTVYGPEHEYDDFIALWNPNQYDPNAWLDLIDQSGAKYFVFTSKHHDGIALFDTKVTDRSTVKLNPHRDFLDEFLKEAEDHFPHLKKGIYFSLPEWYHPSYADDSLHWYGPPKNAYTGREVPYTGSRPIDDFVNELQVPQALEIIRDYKPDIMWCDIGGINNSTVWQEEFLNEARKQGRQVAINDRCGNSVSDFQTVEYRGLNHVPSRFWEATRGLDPYSFGYNHATKDEQYTSTLDLIKEFVGAISKGGNFLLSIGPDGSGQIPKIQADRLLEMGKWIRRVRPSIFESEPYWVTSSDSHEPGQPLFFTQSQGSFYIFSMERPKAQRVVIKTSVPLHSTSTIRMMGTDDLLEWKVFSNGRLIIDVPNEVLDQENLVWVFEISAPLS